MLDNHFELLKQFGVAETAIEGEDIMKFGMRKPNFKKSIKARTTGKIKRTMKKNNKSCVWKERDGID